MPRSPFPVRPLLLGLGMVALGLSLAACSPAAAPDALNRVISTRGLKVIPDQRYGPHERNLLDVYAPARAQGAPTVLFVHGGSWQGGDKAIYRFVGESLARAGYVTGVMNYRLAPQNRYPTYVQDTAAALRWLRDHAGDFGGNPNNLFVVGHSAGAFNAVEAVDNARWLREAGVPVGAVRGVVGIAGPYAYDFRQDSSRVAFPEGSTPDEVMPDRHVRRDAPPHLLLVAANDTTVGPQNALKLEAALKAAGVPVNRTVLPRVNHVTIVAALARPLTFLGGTRQQVIDFIEAHRLK
ncbi:Alpha/betasuperfamily hydrolase [Deinococcus geothermalis DSM 11300]|uniref:Alpha/betasuperfamily hydrolase n=1 Tax=Deinococcus geothermalis (strain DSM 11300 / CIP 105573 / AG-3a) TaxID=319795 RepID=Q1J026_DEIGD|nr:MULTISPECIES: alpha/beta hydrolase [Deinococcus]ABF45158.1 Alpha/betasuperfamily hydrolase [Deinococcus geothermalis DSM 11300]